jgi:hypothetical protein
MGILQSGDPAVDVVGRAINALVPLRDLSRIVADTPRLAPRSTDFIKPGIHQPPVEESLKELAELKQLVKMWTFLYKNHLLEVPHGLRQVDPEELMKLMTGCVCGCWSEEHEAAGAYLAFVETSGVIGYEYEMRKAQLYQAWRAAHAAVAKASGEANG